MAWFRCFVRGENFPAQIVGESGLVGFYVTRHAEAADAAAAETAVLEELRTELTPPPGHIPTGRARVFFEEIAEVDAEQVSAIPPGFAWHSMNDAEPTTAPDPTA